MNFVGEIRPFSRLFSLLLPTYFLVNSHITSSSTKNSLSFPYTYSTQPLTHTLTESKEDLDATLKRLRPQFREDFVTYLRGEYERVSTPPMTEDAVVLANLLQAIQARVLAEVEDMMGADVSQVSRLLAFSDEEQVATALRGSFLAGTLQPAQFLEMVETVLGDLDERMPALLDAGTKNEELREMHRKLSAIRTFTADYVAEMN